MLNKYDKLIHYSYLWVEKWEERDRIFRIRMWICGFNYNDNRFVEEWNREEIARTSKTNQLDIIDWWIKCNNIISGRPEGNNMELEARYSDESNRFNWFD